MTNLKINRLQHIGIPVTDIEISQSFYERLGFQRAMNATFMHEGDEGKVSMMKRDGMTMEEAYEYVTYNVEGAYMGEMTPLYVWKQKLEDLYD
jgi:catechol 2,3-dioxygenase-like lactoylglutathione lyase family enzyme